MHDLKWRVIELHTGKFVAEYYSTWWDWFRKKEGWKRLSKTVFHEGCGVGWSENETLHFDTAEGAERAVRAHLGDFESSVVRSGSCTI
jgi:hypothetical protein